MKKPRKKQVKAPGAGKPEHKPNEELRELVALHATMGTSQETIAKIIKIDPKTLRKYYRDELDDSLAVANATVGGTLFNKAINGDTTAMIFWMKTQARWSEKTETENKTVVTQVNMSPADYKKARQAMLDADDC